LDGPAIILASAALSLMGALAAQAGGLWRDAGVCIGCGEGNPQGLKLRFEWEDGVLATTYTPSPEHQGWEGYTHGGMLSLVLDEVMAQSVYRSGYLAPTAEISVRFRRPAPVGEPLRVTSTAPQGDRLLVCRAEARDAAGTLIADATAKFLPTPAPPQEAQP
jgi:uncharacterized protein (TIGR00369 family)